MSANQTELGSPADVATGCEAVSVMDLMECKLLFLRSLFGAFNHDDNQYPRDQRQQTRKPGDKYDSAYLIIAECF